MISANTETTPAHSAAHHRLAFFRQSGWVMFTMTLGGALMYAAHPVVARHVPKEEYGVFTTLLQVVSLMGIPAAGLGPVFAQQAAAAITAAPQRAGISPLQGLSGAIFSLWLGMAVIVAVFWKQAVANLQITNPAALAATGGVGLVAM